MKISRFIKILIWQICFIMNSTTPLLHATSSNCDKNHMQFYEKQNTTDYLSHKIARWGYWLNWPARYAGHAIEKLTRPFPNSFLDKAEVLRRIQYCASGILVSNCKNI